MAKKNTPESGNWIVAALNSVFGPMAKKSKALPPLLGIALPLLLTILLIAVKGARSPGIFLLVALVIVVLPAAYIVDARVRGQPIDENAPPWAEIESPNPKPFDREIECRGSATGIPRDMHLWLFVEEDREERRLIWPKEGEVIVNKQGKWKHRIFEDGVAQHVSVSLWMANAKAHDSIQKWLAHGKRTGDYPELEGIPGTTRIARVRGIVLKPREP